MSEKTSMPGEVMKWVLEHIEYYCPMDEDAENVMDDFVSNMYMENWEAASESCEQILCLLGNNFYDYVAEIGDDRTIISEYLDAHRLEYAESKREYPIGWLKARENGLEDKAREKLREGIRRDGKINIKREAAGKKWTYLSGSILVIFGIAICVAAAWGRQDWPGFFCISTILIFGGYLICRFNYRRGRFKGKVGSYYQEMAINRMYEKISRIESKQEKIKLYRIMPEKFYDQYTEAGKKTKNVNLKSMWKKFVGNLPRGGTADWLTCGMLVIVLLSITFIPFSPKDNSEAEKEEVSYLPTAKKSLEENGIPDENKEIQVQVKEIEQEETKDEQTEDSFIKEGVIFQDSNERELRIDEIKKLQQRTDMSYREALGYARNEIYARMGYNFNHDGGKYTAHYSRYKWYQDIPKRDVTEDMFNQYERANIDLILSVEKELEEQE